MYRHKAASEPCISASKFKDIKTFQALLLLALTTSHHQQQPFALHSPNQTLKLVTLPFRLLYS